MLPHIQNSVAGVNRMDPVSIDLFEVYFSIPQALQAEFGQDVAILTQQVQSIKGLGTLRKGPEADVQKFMGTSRSFLKDKIETHHDVEIELALNLRDGIDNFIYKLFVAWQKLGYDLSTGSTTLKTGYTADFLKISIGNRAGEVYREIIYKDVMLNGDITGAQDELNYETQDAQKMTVKMRSDWALETNA